MKATTTLRTKEPTKPRMLWSLEIGTEEFDKVTKVADFQSSIPKKISREIHRILRLIL